MSFSCPQSLLLIINSISWVVPLVFPVQFAVDSCFCLLYFSSELFLYTILYQRNFCICWWRCCLKMLSQVSPVFEWHDRSSENREHVEVGLCFGRPVLARAYVMLKHRLLRIWTMFDTPITDGNILSWWTRTKRTSYR